MKIAIMHDTLSTLGGSEKLMITLAKALPADIITAQANPRVIEQLEGNGIKIITLGPQITDPTLRSNVTLRRFARCDFQKKYDYYLFSGIQSIYASKKHHPSLWYCHHLDKVLYEEKTQTRYDRVIALLKNIIPRSLGPGKMIVKTIRSWRVVRSIGLSRGIKEIAQNWQALHYAKTTQEDRRAINTIPTILVNSDHTGKNILALVGRKTTTVYPGIDTSRFVNAKEQDYWLSTNRIQPEKKIHTQINAFKLLPDEKLIIIGQPGDNKLYNTLLKNLPRNVIYKNTVSEQELIALYAHCKGFITTAANEDFGMTAVEALAAGKHVIAHNEGGYREILTKKTGTLLPIMNASALAVAIKNHRKTTPQDCMRRAKKFDIRPFVQAVRKAIQK